MTAPDPSTAQHPISAVETAEIDVATLLAEPAGEPRDAELFFNRELSWLTSTTACCSWPRTRRCR